MRRRPSSLQDRAAVVTFCTKGELSQDKIVHRPLLIALEFLYRMETRLLILVIRQRQPEFLHLVDKSQQLVAINRLNLLWSPKSRKSMFFVVTIYASDAGSFN